MPGISRSRILLRSLSSSAIPDSVTIYTRERQTHHSANVKVKDFKVAIVGGGISGLTCAIALKQAGVSAEVFEAATQFKEIGAGVGLGPNAGQVLRSIGVLDEALDRCAEPGMNMETFLFKSGMEGHELFYDYPGGPEDNGLSAHRPSFLDALVKFVDSNTAHFNKRCTSVSVSEENQSRSVVHFADGTTYEADVVIGADGIKSVVRTALVGEAINPITYSNTVCFRGLVPYETIQAAGVKLDLRTRPICLMGKDKHIIIFPVTGGRLINIVAFVADRTVPMGSVALAPGAPWVTPVSQEEVVKAYDGWSSDVHAILKCIQQPSKWSIHVVHPHLDSFVKGRTALIGDAAHGMLPHMGAGAGQGIEDAYLLARLLGHPQTTANNIETVLLAYDRIRRPRAHMVWEGSVKAGEIYDGYGEHGLNAEGVQQDFGRHYDFLWHRAVDEDVELAINWLKEIAVFS
ncbi:hypothetical protein AcV5_010477 [Taiwanofungus camphoratus]|nr:hypothetical protein AcV5_010477 [Antrodia cinnamomea]